MPTHKVKGGYKWGKSGKVYPTKKQADKQGQAIYASGWRENKNINEAFSPYSLLLMGIIRKTHDELRNKGYDENVVDNIINIHNIQINKNNNTFIFSYQNNPIFEIEIVDDLDEMIIQSSNKMINWFTQNNMVKESINEIGNTSKGQHALGAVRGRALSRTVYQPKYQKTTERNKQGEKAENAFMKGWNHRNDVKDPKELDDMVKSYRQGYDYGFKKGIKENNIMAKKQVIRLTEGDLHRIIKETVNNILKNNSNINEAFSDVYQPHNFSDINKDYYQSYVIVDGTRAVVGHSESYEEAVEDARQLAQRNKYGTFEVYGVDNDGTYALEEEYPEDNTLVYSTDEDFK